MMPKLFLSKMIKTSRTNNRIFSKRARYYDLFRGQMRGTINRLLHVVEFKKNDRVLDIGGGTGAVGRGIKSYVHEIVVLDCADGMVELCKKRDGGVTCIMGYADALPFANESFDKILLIDSFHHFGDSQQKAVSEIYRVLRTGGEVVLEEFNPRTAFGWTIYLLEKISRFGSIFYTPSELSKLWTSYGFDTQVLREGTWRYHAVCKKNKNILL